MKDEEKKVIATQIDRDIHRKFKSKCALEEISLEDKTALLVKKFVLGK